MVLHLLLACLRTVSVRQLPCRRVAEPQPVQQTHPKNNVRVCACAYVGARLSLCVSVCAGVCVLECVRGAYVCL